MAEMSDAVEVAVPLAAAYAQWTRFEEFPRFLSFVDSVRKLDDETYHWAIEIAGTRREFDARVTALRADEAVAWESITGPRNSGEVTFEALGASATRVAVAIEWTPTTFMESMGATMGFDRAAISKDLQNFKRFIEAR